MGQHSRKVVALILATLLGTIGLAITAPKRSSSTQKQQDSDKDRQVQQLPGITGADTPQVIPDPVAWEFFLRSLVPRPEEGEIDVERVQAFAAQVTDDAAEIDLLLDAAKDFEQQVSKLDLQTKQLKDDHPRFAQIFVTY